ncbi:MAG: DUF3047 domain-containing protein [Methylococcaceae bacterium]|nr:DUF3047 domain-containing protein [Methylococcaceae bacterium]MDP3905280.1 DUF3047 domain-containing protein [Methylococcaceae bacterium]
MFTACKTLKFSSLLIFLTINSLSYAEPAEEKIMLGAFSTGSLEQWESKRFKNQTLYQLFELDGAQVLKADSNDSASGLFKTQRIDLQQTPVLNWRWRIENRLDTRNEQIKTGDDYAARVYVVISGGLAFWQTKAINYVWANASAKGAVWPNAYAGKSAVMIAMRSAADPTGTWFSEKRDVLADLKQHFGEDVRYIDAVAIMTDTDDSKGKATSYYGDIYFSQR